MRHQYDFPFEFVLFALFVLVFIGLLGNTNTPSPNNGTTESNFFSNFNETIYPTDPNGETEEMFSEEKQKLYGECIEGRMGSSNYCSRAGVNPTPDYPFTISFYDGYKDFNAYITRVGVFGGCGLNEERAYINKGDFVFNTTDDYRSLTLTKNPMKNRDINKVVLFHGLYEPAVGYFQAKNGVICSGGWRNPDYESGYYVYPEDKGIEFDSVRPVPGK